MIVESLTGREAYIERKKIDWSTAKHVCARVSYSFIHSFGHLLLPYIHFTLRHYNRCTDNDTIGLRQPARPATDTHTRAHTLACWAGQTDSQLLSFFRLITHVHSAGHWIRMQPPHVIAINTKFTYTRFFYFPSEREKQL